MPKLRAAFHYPPLARAQSRAFATFACPTFHGAYPVFAFVWSCRAASFARRIAALVAVPAFAYNVMRLHCRQRLGATSFASELARASLTLPVQHLVDAVFFFHRSGHPAALASRMRTGRAVVLSVQILRIFGSRTRLAPAAHARRLRDASWTFPVRHLLNGVFALPRPLRVATCTGRISAGSAVVAPFVKLSCVWRVDRGPFAGCTRWVHASSASP